MQPRFEMINGVQHIIVAVPVIEPKLSSTGKSLVMAQTGSPQPTGLTLNGKPVTFTMSAWIPKK